jgi:hypothetical protein
LGWWRSELKNGPPALLIDTLGRPTLPIDAPALILSSALLATAIWMIAATYWQLPVSSTQVCPSPGPEAAGLNTGWK